MRVLIACEESQTVCKAFRERGHEAYSCDIQDCSGGHPEWHVKGDALKLINGNCTFITEGGQVVTIDGTWDLLIAHPPCTYLSSAGSVNLLNADHTIKNQERYQKGIEAKAFFMQMYNADCPRIAVENPAPISLFELPRYSQIIEPYMFGDPWKKRTLLWLKNLPMLMGTDVVVPEGIWVRGGGGRTDRTRWDWYSLKGKRNAKDRSKTFPGIAKAMAEQWGLENDDINN